MEALLITGGALLEDPLGLYYYYYQPGESRPEVWHLSTPLLRDVMMARDVIQGAAPDWSLAEARPRRGHGHMPEKQI